MAPSPAQGEPAAPGESPAHDATRAATPATLGPLRGTPMSPPSALQAVELAVRSASSIVPGVQWAHFLAHNMGEVPTLTLAASGGGVAPPQEVEIPVSEGLLGWVARSGLPAIESDAQKKPGFSRSKFKKKRAAAIYTRVGLGPGLGLQPATATATATATETAETETATEPCSDGRRSAWCRRTTWPARYGTKNST